MWKTNTEFFAHHCCHRSNSRSAVRYSIQSAAACTACWQHAVCAGALLLVHSYLVANFVFRVLFFLFFPGMCQSVTTASTSTCCWSGTQAKLHSEGMKGAVPMAGAGGQRGSNEKLCIRGAESMAWRRHEQIHNRKSIIYSMLAAHNQSHCQHLNSFMQEYHCTVENAIQDHIRKTGPKACSIPSLLKALTELLAKQWDPPVEFEQHVLQWKHTASEVHHAASKQLQRGSYNSVAACCV